MKTTIVVDVSGHYRDEQTTCRAKLAMTKQGVQYAHIGSRQIKSAADRCCYAGDDRPVFANLPGFSIWQTTQDGIVSYKL